MTAPNLLTAPGLSDGKPAHLEGSLGARWKDRGVKVNVVLKFIFGRS
jgi:hypothetical protein